MTTTTENVRTWATTKAGNASADAAITSADTQSPDTVDDNIRSIMASVRRESDDRGGAIVAGGTSTALTATTASGIASAHIANGLPLVVRTSSAATGPATIAIDGLAAVTLKKQGGTAIASGDWASGDFLLLYYSSTATAFIASNISAAINTPAQTASFRATKSASQSVATSAETTITFNTEAFDVGSKFASNAWTPPAGTCLLHLRVTVSTAGTGSKVYVRIKKDGAVLATGRMVINANNSSQTMDVSAIDQCSGANAYTATVENIDDSSYTIEGASVDETAFQGTML